ncbi:hypothetical protein DMN91_001519 [Ooceraea biroi]|uniref:EB domain-containing protein n=1 Tax=Ooceraea biroi TaxID=2015173 RepID=A0A3L8DYR0_OOCBI|nr:hypothetical protein DMN91_001519 [Ooceraea biroi]
METLVTLSAIVLMIVLVNGQKIEYGDPCMRNQDCLHIEGAVCTNDRKCRCEAETILNTNGTKCLAAAKKIRDECVDIAQCTTTFEHSACIDNMCQCEPDYHYENAMTRCFLNKALDDECANDYECYQAENYMNDSPTRPLKCEANKCTCADNYVRDNKECINSGKFIACGIPINDPFCDGVGL